MELEDIRKNYRNFNDDKIENLAKSDARKLRPEVIPILIEEIRRRNFKLYVRPVKKNPRYKGMKGI